MADLLGWLATAVVAASYFTRGPKTLRRIQGAGACMWLAYGVLIHSWPVIAANVIVASAALLTSLRPPAPDPAVDRPRG
jgi:hypothetical protein